MTPAAKHAIRQAMSYMKDDSRVLVYAQTCWGTEITRADIEKVRRSIPVVAERRKRAGWRSPKVVAV